MVLELLVINYVIPLWFAYGRYFEEPDWQERCFDLLQEVSAENNHIIRRFKSHGWTAGNGFDSQGMMGFLRTIANLRNAYSVKLTNRSSNQNPNDFWVSQ